MTFNAVEYDLPFLSFVVSYLRRTLIYVICFRDNSETPIHIRIDRLLSTYNSIQYKLMSIFQRDA